jgi:hypothetical protein
MHICRLAVLVLAITALLTSAEQAERQSVRLLAIGNSFSNNILNQLPALAKAGGRTLEFEHCMFGGARLEQHWARVEASEHEPVDPKTLYASKRTLRQALALKPWDVVTIQQYSFISHDPATYRPYADKLVGLIREVAPQATVMMHMTWAYRSDDPRFVSVAKEQESQSNQAETIGAKAAPVEMRTSADMHRMVAAAYRSVAKDLGLGLIPVGDAFAQVEIDPVWGFVADASWDPKTAVAPALPDQSRSLHGGWYWKQKDGKPVLDADGKPVLGYDGHHANRAGEYLGACVWYEMLFHASPVGVDYRPAGMPEAQALFLQETAHRVAQAELAAQ